MFRTRKRNGKIQNPIKMPEEVAAIMELLERHGSEAYIVGGCVRDHYLGRTPKDYDIAAAMRPKDVMRLFEKTRGYGVIPTGLKHGTVTVMPKGSGEGYEITTFRNDGDYSDGRHPDSVAFADSIEEDLSRRDLTINAMAYSPRTGLIDPFGGLKDLDAKTVRCVGDPNARFGEDALRMMRAVRFCAQLGFSMTKETENAVKNNAQLIDLVSEERKCDEIMKILKSPNPGAMRMLEQAGLMERVLPEVHSLFSVMQNNPWHLYSAGEHTMRVLENSPDDPKVRLAALFHDVGKAKTRVTDAGGVDHFPGHPAVSAEMAHRAMRRMRLPNETIADVKQLVDIHDANPLATETAVRRFASRNSLSPEQMGRYHALVKADALAQNLELSKDKIRDNDRVLEIYNDISSREQALSVKDLAVNGHDVMSLGYKGKDVGRMLDRLLENVLENPEANDKEKLMEQMRQMEL